MRVFIRASRLQDAAADMVPAVQGVTCTPGGQWGVARIPRGAKSTGGRGSTCTIITMINL